MAGITFSVREQRMSSGLSSLSASFARRLQDATTFALTATAIIARDAARAEARGKMTVRTPYTIGGIQILSAKVSDGQPVATLFGSPVGYGGVPYLSQQAVGGTRVSAQGGQHVAVPSAELRSRYSRKPIPQSMLPSTLGPKGFGRVKNALAALGKGTGGAPFWMKYQSGGRTITALAQHNERERVASRVAKWQASHSKELKRAAYTGKGKKMAWRAYIARLRLQEMGSSAPMPPMARSQRLKFLWSFPTSQIIEKRYDFFTVAAAVARREFPAQLRAATTKYLGSG